MPPLLEALLLLFLAALSSSPQTFAGLVGAYLLSKIVRSWLRGCLPGGLGGRTGSRGSLLDDDDGDDGDDDDCVEGDGSDHFAEGEGSGRSSRRGRRRRRRRGEAGSSEAPGTRLVRLGDDASEVLDRVMREDGDGGNGGGKSSSSRRSSSGNNNGNNNNNNNDDDDDREERATMQIPKLKEQHRKEGRNADGDDAPPSAPSEAGGEAGGEAAGGDADDDGAAAASAGDDEEAADGGAPGRGRDAEDRPDAIAALVESTVASYSLDPYPYSFSPLLLFTSNGYFDRGYSNYNAVAAFFAPALRDLGREDGRGDGGGGGGAWDGGGNDGNGGGDDGGSEGSDGPAGIDMLSGVVYDRKNMTYDELFAHVADASALVTCCIDAHFTAFKLLPSARGGTPELLYYDPLRPSLHVARGERDVHQAALYLMMKCHYGDNAHVQENKKHYTGPGSTRLQNAVDRAVLPASCGLHPIRFAISSRPDSLSFFRIASIAISPPSRGQLSHVEEDQQRHHVQPRHTLVAAAAGPVAVPVRQRQGQPGTDEHPAHGEHLLLPDVPVSLSAEFGAPPRGAVRFDLPRTVRAHSHDSCRSFALFCKVGKPVISSDGRSIVLRDPALLERATIRISQFLLTFFVDADRRVIRPYTNSNFIIDFYRYSHSPYYGAFVKYLRHHRVRVPDYEKQYEGVSMYYSFVKELHGYDKFVLEGATPSTPNSKSLQRVTSSEGASRKLGRGDYYKYRAANLMFGCNAGAMFGLASFSEFNSWRKNQLLEFYDVIKGRIGGLAEEMGRAGGRLTKYRDYYFMPLFEVGQRELIDIHHYTYLIDMCSMGKATGRLAQIVTDINSHLVNHIYFSTQNRNTYQKMMKTDQFVNSKRYMHFFQQNFLSVDWFSEYLGLGFSDINPKEKDINSLTQTVFYLTDLMRHQGYRQEYEFEKECINQMARSNVRRFEAMFTGGQTATQKYESSIKIGFGFTYSKYNTLMHFLNVAECYWANPDVNNIQFFGKDVRTLLSISCQKIFFDPKHSGYYYYGPFELRDTFRTELDLAVASGSGRAGASVAATKHYGANWLTITDRVYEHSYLKGILDRLFQSANNTRLKSDNGVLNLLLLSLQLDFGLFDQYAKLLNIPFMKDLQHEADTKELQVEIANLIYDFDRKHSADSVTRSKVEELIFEVSYKFIVNKNFDVHSNQFKLISMLNADPDYQEYVLLVKIYMSLCSINKSVEVDYYKVKVNGSFHIIIPSNFSKKTSEYLEDITVHHSFSESDGIMMYDDIHVFDLRPHQPEINLYKIRLEPSDEVQSMVKYIEISNVFQALSSEKERYLIFIADNSILVDVMEGGKMNIKINQVDAKVSTIYFNEAISFIPCFRFTEGEDVIMFTSRNIHYLVDKGGQFCPDYYGMKHELIECIISEELFVDLNDDPCFKKSKLSELLTESKIVVYFPDYYLLVSSRQQLINLLDFALYVRNVGFFILVLIFLRRSSMTLEYQEKRDKNVVQITGPWKEAILYVLGHATEPHYDSIFEKQFVNIDQHKTLPLREFIEVLSENFTRYQRHVDGEYQIVPREKQKRFLEKIICGDECFHFSEVGSGKTKGQPVFTVLTQGSICVMSLTVTSVRTGVVIMPLLCQIFLSSNAEAHKHLARGGKQKDTLIILVPEHLLPDARTQVFRHCLNLNFRQEYRVFDDILTLLHKKVVFSDNHTRPMKQIFVTSFNQFKKALTYDKICKKIRPHREHILVVADEVDDFLDRDKLVFNICSNKANSFDRNTLEYFHETSHAAYNRQEYQPSFFQSSPNPAYWRDLHSKFRAIHDEIQEASKSLNKSFGIFNENTLRHCQTSISHDIEGYKALIARPYESVNRAMPGSYYSDVERTIFLTFVILSEDIAKYDELFQGERKFITFEYWKEFLAELDYDELVYGHDRLSEIADKHPKTLGGLIRFLYIIILKRMEVRDRSKSVNSVDIIFNFDCIGFTGTPFLDNYPTSNYIRHQREDDIPPCIDRSFYAYTSEELPTAEFERRFALFQGQNSNVQVEYVPSDFMHISLKVGEMDTLKEIFEREATRSKVATEERIGRAPFNAIVDLCGIFKLSNIDDVRSMILKLFGPDCFHYIYHIDQTDGSDRMLCIKSKNDVTFDEEFYKFLMRTYGAGLREKVFFFIDNRNYIGKDVPYQLVYQKHYKLPLFMKSVVIAHDVEDFSKIWQAMGRSRTMNETTFSIYKDNIPVGFVNGESGLGDIKKQPLTTALYTKNCDRKMAGNLSSIYQTLIALYNLSQQSFYYSDEIVNTFIEKMEKTIATKVKQIEGKIADVVLGSPVPAQILQHIFLDKFRRSSNESVSKSTPSTIMVDALLRQIVRQKFEQRLPSGDIYDDYIRFLSGEQQSLMEISYTKQQQKQKQKQKAKSQDSDTMDVFDKKNQLHFVSKMANYFDETSNFEDDTTKAILSLPVSVPIFSAQYSTGGETKVINVYPTVQFLYSHHIMPRYINEEVKSVLSHQADRVKFCSDFLASVTKGSKKGEMLDPSNHHAETMLRYIKQNPQFSLVGIKPGVYIIGMKDQFSIHDRETHPLRDHLQYAMDEVGFVLFDKTNSKGVDDFGPYFIEQYILLDVLSKQEVAQNVITYYHEHKDKLDRCLQRYDEKQGKGFICWRFLINQAAMPTE
ncbi:hypothetical protein ACHAWF_019036 [Thalassiosira exigua]